ncbi:MAG: addiction module protein [Bacteroidales bacterium]|nr:addiction module protein [Bacteroidales bacterium]
MTVEERVALMEELWASFDRDELEYPVPAWHEKVLDERANSKEEDFISLSEVKKSLQSELNDA